MVARLVGTRESLGPPLAENEVADGKMVLCRGFTNARVCLFLLKIEPIAGCGLVIEPRIGLLDNRESTD